VGQSADPTANMVGVKEEAVLRPVETIALITYGLWLMLAILSLI